ncbi:SEC-C metal-binding domain-containing protein [Paenibacillus caui]|uniref:SEC-C metal-binding domain-containing protein n=1 Tax=Paenibacillus caui TaxID=2873927 RepID=UPI001CA7FA3D|nr:SEC-C metal-binding domain-containing protein [Paenibacillus caui]
MLSETISLYEQINIEHAIKGDPTSSLAEALLCQTKAKLSYLASAYNVAGRSKMKKEQLAEALVERMKDPASIRPVLLLVKDVEWKLFETLLRQPMLQDNGYPYGYYAYLLEHGLVFTFYQDSKLYLVMPEEIKHAFNKIDQAEFRNTLARYRLIHDYVLALTNLYGAYKPDRLVNIFNAQNKEVPLGEDEFAACLNHFLNRDEYFTWHEGYIVDISLVTDESDDELKALLSNVAGKPYYIPDQDTLLKYKDDSYFEITPQLKALRNYVLQNMCPDTEIVDNLVDDVQLACSMEASLQEIIYEFERRQIHFDSMDQAQKVTSLIVDVYNNTRKWSNGGHTPAELSKRSGRAVVKPLHQAHYFPNKKEQVSVTKIGRNEPCPCGSGLKYKKCCGK